MTIENDPNIPETEPVRFIATIASAGHSKDQRQRHIITVPAKLKDKLDTLKGRPLVVTLSPVL